MDLSGISGLGGAGAVGGGGYSASSSATSGARGSQDLSTGGGGGSAGNRGFYNNVAFPGATLNTDQGINPPAGTGNSKTLMTVLAGIGGLVVLLFLVKKFA